MPAGRSIVGMGSVLFGALGCSTWTSFHSGYGFAPKGERSLVGAEVRRAVGTRMYGPHALIGARVDEASSQVDAELHAGAMYPIRLVDDLSLLPSASVDLLRLSDRDGHLRGGALGPGAAVELLFWLRTNQRRSESALFFGCFGGMAGVDCPHVERARVARVGIGLRAAAEYDVLLDRQNPRSNAAVLWLTFGTTRAVSEWEEP
jgi:hypothetical protein